MDGTAPVAPDIYRYYDYHAFLRDHYEWRKTVNAYFSLRFIGGKVGLDAGLVVRILQGKRPLSLKKIPAFSAVMGLSKRRAEYFELLVLYGRAKSDREAQQYFEKLIGFTGLGGKQVDRSQYEFYQEWYYTAVREISIPLRATTRNSRPCWCRLSAPRKPARPSTCWRPWA
jgi:uncharacterized protein (TIGR02147 family)